MSRIIDNFDYIFKTTILLISLSLGALFLMAGMQSAFAAALKPITTVESPILTAGDIFDGLSEEKASTVLGTAPLPGKDMVIDSTTLYRIAAALDLNWRPAQMSDTATIRRSATLITTEHIKETLQNKIREQGVSGRFNLHFSGVPPQIVLPHNHAETFDITAIRFTQGQERFEATIAAPSADHPVSQIVVSGTIERLISVPVLKNTLRFGEVIGAQDIHWIDVPDRRVQHDILLKESEIIGMTPRRMVLAGKPLLTNDLQSPQMVSRGDIITIILKDNMMTLTAKGKALQDGAKGDLIRVVNASSNRPIAAIVSGDGQVSVVTNDTQTTQ